MYLEVSCCRMERAGLIQRWRRNLRRTFSDCQVSCKIYSGNNSAAWCMHTLLSCSGDVQHLLYLGLIALMSRAQSTWDQW